MTINLPHGDPCPMCHGQAFMDASDAKSILCPSCGIRAKDKETWNQLARLPKTVAVGINWRTHFLQIYPDRATALRFIEFDAGDSLEEKPVVTDQEPTKVDPVSKPANSPQPKQVVFLLDGHQYTGTVYPPSYSDVLVAASNKAHDRVCETRAVLDKAETDYLEALRLASQAEFALEAFSNCARETEYAMKRDQTKPQVFVPLHLGEVKR